MESTEQLQAPAMPNVRQRRVAERAEKGEHASFPDSINVGRGERLVSGAAGSILALLGLSRRDVPGLLIAGVGGALLYRGVSGHSYAYETLGIDAVSEREKHRRQHRGTHITKSFLINKSPDELYRWWRNFENLPQVMSHLEAVQVLDERRSHWIAKAPSLYGGRVEWDAEITADQPNQRIAWSSLPGADIEHRGEITFKPAPGDRGTAVRVEIDYLPPAGQVGRLLAWFSGEEPALQIRDDLRNFKRLMEIGEIPTISGQPHGTCGMRTTQHEP